MIRFLSRLWYGAVFPPDPERPEPDGWAVWRAFQDAHDERLEEERRRHGKPGEVEAHRSAIVHSALAFGSRSIPSRGVSS